MERTNNAGRRGSALILVLFISLVLAGMLYYICDVGLSSSRSSVLNADRVQATATAEFAANLAIANLADVEYKDITRSVVNKDWVGRNLFDSTHNDQRRIAGTLNGYDYMVRVKSLRAARANNSMPDGWLKGFDLSSFSFGADPVSKFSDVYEITAVARNSQANPNAVGTAWQIPESMVKTVVSVAYDSAGSTRDELGVLALNTPEGLVADPNIKVSGEDHYGVRTAVTERTVVKEINEVENIAAEDSQLFSVTGTEWSAGRLTAHYQRGDAPNPLIPRTTAFSTSEKDHKMIALDPGVQSDLYVFGGKVSSSNYSVDRNGTGFYLNYEYGRSVTLDDSLRIIENTQTEAEPGSGHAATALAVGKAEDLLRIYLNFSNDNKTPSPTSRPTVSATELAGTPTTSDQSSLANWRSKWRQAPIAYFSRQAMRNYQDRNNMPLDNSNSPLRRHPAAKIWIKNADGEFLVRDYQTYNSGQRARPVEKWSGYYTWAPYGGYVVSDSGEGKTHICWPLGRFPQAIWQRIVHTRFLTLEELTGYQMTQGNDGLPAKLSNPANPASIIGGVPDFVLDGSGNKIPYRVGPSSDTQFNEAYQRSNTADNYAANPGTTFVTSDAPPLDGIYVRYRDANGNYILNGDGTIKTKCHKVMDDFRFKRNIALPGDPVDERDMVVFHMVLENTLTPADEQVNPSNTRMYFDMGMTVTLVSARIDTETDQKTVESGRDYQWWEGEVDHTLTGNESHYSVSFNLPPEIKAIANPADRLREIYKLMGLGDPADMSLAANIYTMLDLDGKKVMFPRALFDLDEERPAGTANPNYGVLLHTVAGETYYYSHDDVLFFLDKLALDADTLSAMTAAQIEQAAVDEMKRLNPTVADFKPLDERFSIVGVTKSTLPDAMKIPNKYVTARSFASKLFGYKTINVPAVFTRSDAATRIIRRDFYGTTASNPSQAIDPITLDLGFLPGEHNQKSSEATLVADGHVPMLINPGGTQPDGSAIQPKFIWEATYRSDIRTVPSFINMADVQNKFGGRDARGGLGWHRKGPNAPAASLEQDHYEYIILAREEYEPYKTMTGDQYIAYISQTPTYNPADTSQTLTPGYDFTASLKPTSEMPTFVIDKKPLDGAGILVVNGNLLVKTTFAFSGNLVVLGDLTVEPELQDVMRVNGDNKPVNADGVALTWDPAGLRYYYLNATGDQVPSTPAVDHTYRGELVLQGKVMVGGKVSVAPADPISGAPAGKIDLRGSTGALEDAEWPGVDNGLRLERVNWLGDESIPTKVLWDKQID